MIMDRLTFPFDFKYASVHVLLGAASGFATGVLSPSRLNIPA